MRRAIALLLLCLVPLQYTWAAASLHEHPGEAAAGELLHIGSHPAVPDPADPDRDGGAGQLDGDRGPHCHHMPPLTLLDSGFPAAVHAPARPAAISPGDHPSYIPPVRDRPPRDLA